MSDEAKKMHDIAVAVGLMVDACYLVPDLDDLVLGAKSLRRRFEAQSARIAELEGARATFNRDAFMAEIHAKSFRNGPTSPHFVDVADVYRALDWHAVASAPAVAQAEAQEHVHEWLPTFHESKTLRPGHSAQVCATLECHCERWEDGTITRDGESLAAAQPSGEGEER